MPASNHRNFSREKENHIVNYGFTTFLSE